MLEEAPVSNSLRSDESLGKWSVTTSRPTMLTVPEDEIMPSNSHASFSMPIHAHRNLHAEKSKIVANYERKIAITTKISYRRAHNAVIPHNHISEDQTGQGPDVRSTVLLQQASDDAIPEVRDTYTKTQTPRSTIKPVVLHNQPISVVLNPKMVAIAAKSKPSTSVSFECIQPVS